MGIVKGIAPSPERTRAPLAVAGVFAVLTLGLLIYQSLGGGPPADARPALKVRAAPYRWTAACPQDDYRHSASLPRGCGPNAYLIRNYRELGLASTYRAHYWYRVGDDAVLMNCAGGYCMATLQSKDKFIR
jgi:hypothetical protein